jgi:hypothetical protein
LTILKSKSKFDDLKDKYQIPPAFETAKVPTQIAVGTNYWSCVHIDDDYYYTTLSCLSPVPNDRSILFYFVFPSYKVAVPMRSGDVMIFNPSVFHCCTNPTKKGVHIFSLYVSAKTCNTQIASMT